MTANPGIQLSLDVKGRLCVVIGGGEEAADKAQRLVESGAKVTVISPSLHTTLRKLTASGKVLHRARGFRGGDTEGALLVLNTIRDDPAFSSSLLETAKHEGFLLWSVDQPQASTVIMPAVVSRGHLRLAIGTSGVAPAFARRLREELERLFDDEMSRFVAWLADLREETRREETDPERRRERLREAVDGFRVVGHVEYPKIWREEQVQS